MALFRLEAKVFGREKRGRSVVAAAAYRANPQVLADVVKQEDKIRRKLNFEIWLS